MAEINEYKTGAQSNYGFPLTFDVSKKAPAIAKRIWGTYNDALAWINDPNQNAVAGLQLSVINDTDAKKNGVYFVSKIGEGVVDESGNYTGGELIKVGDGTGSLAINRPTIDDAGKVAEATSDNIGQIIYITTAPSPDATDEDKKYGVGPYIVTGEGTLSSIGISDVDNPDLSSTVAALGGRVSTLEEAVTKETTGLLAVVGNADSGLVKKTNDLSANKVDKVDGMGLSQNSYTNDEKTKLEGIASGAQVNVIESVKVDGTALEVTDKAVDIILPVTGVVEGDNILSLDGKNVKSTLSFAREDVEGKDSLVVKGKDGVIGSVEVADFVVDGMLESVAPKEEGSNIFVFTFNSAAGSKSFEVDFSKYVDTYNADNTTIELGSDNTFKVKDGVFEAHGEAAKVQSALDAYIGTNDAAISEINTKFGDYVTSTTLGTTLGDYAKTADVNKTLEDYAKTADVNKTLEDYAKTADVNASLDLKADKSTLSSYVTSDSLTTTLGDYVTSTALGTTLNGYYTKDAVDTELAKYVLTETFTNEQTRVNNELAKKLEASALDPYLKSTDAESTYWKKANLVAMTNEEINNIISGTYTE